MLSAFASAFRTPDLRNKIFFTLLMIALYRVGATLPSPGVSFGNVQKCLDIVESHGLQLDQAGLRLVHDLFKLDGCRLRQRTRIQGQQDGPDLLLHIQ